MSEVKRFNIGINEDDNLEREEHPNGDYVLYSDYEKLQAEIKRLNLKYDYQLLVKENAALKEKLSEYENHVCIENLEV